MANLSAVTGTNRDAAGDLQNAGWSDQQIADWLKTRAPASEVAGFLGGPTAGYATAGGDMSPMGLAAAFKQPDVTLPNGEAAKSAFRDLQMDSVGGLRRLIGSDPQAERQKLIDAIYGNAREGINYDADRLAQDARERTNARNMGTSSALSYELDPIERGRAIGLERAKNDAFAQANAIGNANQNASLTALGQAFNQGTSGLTTDASVEAGNRAANQSAVQAGYSTGAQLSENEKNRQQQNTQFGRSLEQQKNLQEQSFQNARDIATGNAIGAGIGGLASIFGPTLNKVAGSFF